MNVLLLGDSHTVGTYGNALEKLFSNVGYTVKRVAHTGATANDYLTGAYRDEYKLLTQDRFDIAIVTLGTNDAAASDTLPYATAAARIKALISGLNATRKFYVGPPSFSSNAASTYNKAFAKEDLNSRASKLLAAIRSVGVGATIIDSRTPTASFTSSTDIHFGTAGGNAWAQYVFDSVDVARLKSAASSSVSKMVLLGGVAFIGWKWWERRQSGTDR